MFTLTREEAVRKAVESVGSYDLVTLPEYKQGREDIAAMFATSYDGDGITYYFVVVWKNTRGINCKTAKVPRKKETWFMIYPEFEKGDEKEIKDIRIEEVTKELLAKEIERKWLN